MNPRKLEIARQSVIRACVKCGGQGCKECNAKAECFNIWSVANIPVAYWTLTLKTFPGHESVSNWVKECIGSLDKIYADGKSFSLNSSACGLGKTFAACEVLKRALVAGYTARYTTMPEAIDMVSNKEERIAFKSVMLDADFVVIDEFDRRFLPGTDYGKELFGSTMENIIRSRFQNKLPIIFCSNETEGKFGIDVVFDGLFAQSFGSLFSKSNVINVPIFGVDLR